MSPGLRVFRFLLVSIILFDSMMAIAYAFDGNANTALLYAVVAVIWLLYFLLHLREYDRGL